MFIRHKRFLDICFEVIEEKFDFLYIRGYWVNMGFVESWYLPTKEVIGTVDRKSEWEKCVKPEKCLRYAQWVSL